MSIAGEFHPFRESTDDERRRDNRKRQLEGDKDGFGNSPAETIHADTPQEHRPESTDKGVEIGDSRRHAIRIESQAIATDNPKDGDNACQHKALHQDREHVVDAH